MSVQNGGYRAVRRRRTVTVCDETSGPGRHAGCPQAQVSVRQKRHGEHDSVTVTIADGFRSASYDLSIFIRAALMTSDVTAVMGLGFAAGVPSLARLAYLRAVLPQGDRDHHQDARRHAGR
jgi:hypothetical protein